MLLRDAQAILSMSTVQTKQFMLERKTFKISFRRKPESICFMLGIVGYRDQVQFPCRQGINFSSTEMTV